MFVVDSTNDASDVRMTIALRQYERG
jgi:hypothetical protein